jgi:hypothetical protein
VNWRRANRVVAFLGAWKDGRTEKTETFFCVDCTGCPHGKRKQDCVDCNPARMAS